MKRSAVVLAITVLTVLIPHARAQDLSDREISAVNIQGLEQVSEQQVRAKLEVQPGQNYNPRAVARDIRRLYDLGFFRAIKVDAVPENGTLVLTYIVEEKRLIDEVKILGNKKVNTRNIRGVLTWREGDAFVEEAYTDEREAILKLYRSKGFLNAKVDIVVEDTGPSRVSLTYAIEEGKKARIHSIRFTGNDVLSRRRLKKIMKTHRRWLFLGGKYDEDKFENDLQNIVDEYGNHGRLEADITDTDFAYSSNGKKLNITVAVSEGPEYRVAVLDTAGNIVFDDDEVMGLLDVQSGDVHNVGQVADDADLVEKGYQDSGYVNARVDPQVTLDKEAKTTHVVHRVSEGDLKYIRELRITGNSVTRDDVVRRQMLINPGERFDGGLLRASEHRLENTEYFEDIRITLEDEESNDLFSNVLVDVDEGKTGNFNFGFGYSTEESFGGYTELELNNFDITNWPSFSGGGQRLQLSLHLGDVRSQYSLSFTDPEIMGYPLAFGFDIFDRVYEYSGGVDYTESSRGAQLRLGKQLSPFVDVRTALRYSEVEVTDLPRGANWQLERQQGGSTTISSIWGISRNTLDIRRDPTTGAKHELQLELAGLGGDNHFYKIEHDSTWYRPLGKNQKWIFMYRTREGYAAEYGGSEFVPISDRFFAGGTATIRGYEYRDVGPKEKRWIWFGESDSVGGNLRLLNTVEFKYKLTEKVRFYVFADAGGVWRDASEFDFGDIKYSAGVGLGAFIPKMGPIRVDYGFALNPDGDQGSGRLHMQTGLRF